MWSGEVCAVKLKVFAMGDPWMFFLISQVTQSYAWLLGDEEICSRRVASDFEKFFIAIASTYIARLNGETMCHHPSKY